MEVWYILQMLTHHSRGRNRIWKHFCCCPLPPLRNYLPPESSVDPGSSQKGGEQISYILQASHQDKPRRGKLFKNEWKMEKIFPTWTNPLITLRLMLLFVTSLPGLNLLLESTENMTKVGQSSFSTSKNSRTSSLSGTVMSQWMVISESFVSLARMFNWNMHYSGGDWTKVSE